MDTQDTQTNIQTQPEQGSVGQASTQPISVQKRTVMLEDELNSLVYKVMPKGYAAPPASMVMPAQAVKHMPAPPQPAASSAAQQAAPGAIKLAPDIQPPQSMRAPLGPDPLQMAAREGITNSATGFQRPPGTATSQPRSAFIPPAPSRINPVAGQPLDRNPFATRKPNYMRYALIALGIIVIIGAAWFAFAKFKYKTPTSPQANITSQSNTSNPTGNSQNQNATNTQASNGNQTSTSQIPDSWRIKYFGAALCAKPDICGDTASPSNNGLTNIEAYKLGTDPNSKDSDADGLGDGDEVHVFNTDPLNPKTGGVAKYSDAGDVKYHYNSKAHRPYTGAELCAVSAAVAQYGLHDPTINTIGAVAVSFYTNYASANSCPGASSTGTQTNSQTGTQAGALDRDSQRSDAITQIAEALLKYKVASGSYPNTVNFDTMIAAIKPSLGSRALNTKDPLNKSPYVYAYQSDNTGMDFSLSYFSETQNQQVVVHQAEAQKFQASATILAHDTQRKADLDQIVNALMLYSGDNANPAKPDVKVFPKQSDWKNALKPKYLNPIPADPQTTKDYSYTVSSDQSSFALQAQLEQPPTGKKGYLCTQDGCGYY